MEITARDMRASGEPAGVISLVADVTYDTSLIDVIGISHPAPFSTNPIGTVDDASGMVDDAGALGDVNPPADRSPQRVLSLEAVVTAAAPATLDVATALGLDATGVVKNLIYGQDSEVAADEVLFHGASIDVVQPAVFSFDFVPAGQTAGQTALTVGPGAAVVLEVRAFSADKTLATANGYVLDFTGSHADLLPPTSLVTNPSFWYAQDGDLSDNDVTYATFTPVATGLDNLLLGTLTITFDAGATALGSAVAAGTTTVVTTGGDADLLDGTHAITARQTAPGDLESEASAPLSITVDTVAPTASVPDLAPGSDTGTSDTDNVTQGVNPQFTGTADDGGSGVWKVEVIDAVSAADTSSPFYSVTLPTLSEGSHTVVAIAYDVAGNTFTTAGLPVTVDRAAPTVTVDVAATLDRTPPLSGTVDDASATIQITVGGIHYAAVNNGTTWTLPDDTIAPPMAPATYDVHAAATDVAGNTGADGTTDELTISVGLPLAGDDTAEVAEDAAVDVDVLSNDTDPDGTVDPATVAIVDAPAHGAATPNPDGTVTYQPAANYSGPDTFTYTVRDNEGNLSNVAEAVITVTPVNDAPVADAGSDVDAFDEDTDWSCTVTLDASASMDPDGPSDIVSYVWQEDGQTVATGPSPVLALPIGVHVLLLTVTDAAGAGSADAVEITVNNGLGAPPFAMASADAIADIAPGQTPVPVTWTGQLPGSTLDLWFLGPAGWQRASAGLDAQAGQIDWDSASLSAGWYRLACRITGGAGGVAFALAKLGEACGVAGRWDSADKDLQEAAALADQIVQVAPEQFGARANKASTLYLLAEAQRQLGKDRQATASLRGSLAVLERLERDGLLREQPRYEELLRRVRALLGPRGPDTRPADGAPPKS